MLTEVTIRVEETLVNGVQVEGHVTAKTQEEHKGIALKNSKASTPLIYESCSDSSGYLGSWDSNEDDDEDSNDENWSSAVSELSSSDDEEGWSSAASHCSEEEDIGGKEQEEDAEEEEVDQLISDGEEGGWSSAASHCSSEKDEDRVDQLASDDSEEGDDESDERMNRFCRAKGNSAIGSRSSSPSPPHAKLNREEHVVEMSTLGEPTAAWEEKDKVRV